MLGVCMRTFATAISFFAVVTFIGCRTDQKQGMPLPNPNVDKALEGTWKVIAIEADLQKTEITNAKGRKILYTFAGNELTIHQDEKDPVTSKFSTDDSVTPRRMVIFASNRPERCVYEITGNQLRLCIIV